MKRQNSLLSSSSRAEISADKLSRSESFGCISAILHFLSKNQSSSKKCITFVNNKSEDDATSSLSETKYPAQVSPSLQGEGDTTPQNPSFNTPRIAAPMLEFERSESVTSAENFRAAPGIIARLMGLESCTDGTTQPTAVPETAFEKQRQIMVALEKCEQDLKALKKFIDAFGSAESLRSSPATLVGEKTELVSEGSYRDFMFWEQQPSPVSVLEEFSRPRHFVNVHGSSMFSEPASANFGRTQLQQRPQMQRKKLGEMDIFNPISVCKGKTSAESSWWGGKAIKDTVDEVCKNISWGQKREMGRIGLALQHQICGDLIEEVVKDLKFSGKCNYSSLPFEACKRRLCF